MSSSIDAINAALANSSATLPKQPTQAANTPQLGQDEFMKLMLAQLKNQDPFKPQDPSAFLGQLAQFSSVTGIQNMQTSLSGLADSLRSAQLLSGTNLVGHDVLAETSNAYVGDGGKAFGMVDIPAGASAVQVNIRDGAGVLVRRMQLPTQEGSSSFTWDGTTDTGATAPAGNYKFEILASVGGQSQSLSPQLASRVESVTIDSAGGALKLNTTTGTISLNDVRQVM